MSAIAIFLQSNAKDDGHQSMKMTVQTHRLQVGNHSVEFCNVGASITALNFLGDDLVLGYASGEALRDSGNPMYLGAIVGRVANRISNGTFQLHSEGRACRYQLECNDGHHHLHGGHYGLHRQVWHLEQLSDSTILFSHLSTDGDEGYPGTVLFKALYSVKSSDQNAFHVSLHLTAQLLPCPDGSIKASPVNLAQHSYFNLDGHDSPQGILHHNLWMPTAKAFLPVDEQCIPTKRFADLDSQEARWLDFRQEQTLIDVLVSMAKDKGLDDSHALDLISNRDFSCSPWKPFGIDVSFVLEPKPIYDQGPAILSLAAVLSHPNSRRRLRIYTDAPAVQVYTGHYLSTRTHESKFYRKGNCDEREMYPPFSGICLETQHFPDSISCTIGMEDDVNNKAEWDRGQCVILIPGIREHYSQHIEYHFDLI